MNIENGDDPLDLKTALARGDIDKNANSGLMRGGFRSGIEVAFVSGEEIRTIRGIGTKQINQIKDWLAKNGLQFGESRLELAQNLKAHCRLYLTQEEKESAEHHGSFPHGRQAVYPDTWRKAVELLKRKGVTNPEQTLEGSGFPHP